MSSNKRLGSPMDREKVKELRSDASQTSFSDNSTVLDGSVAGMSGITTEGTGPVMTGLFKGTNEGAWRESFTVDVVEMDGKKFLGSLTRKEMSGSIYSKALGLRPENLHGFVPGYRGHPTIKYRLKEKINIDLDLQGKSKFTFDRTDIIGSETIVHTFICEIAGIRSERDSTQLGLPEQGRSRYTWIKVEGSEYELPKEDIVGWLMKYGNPITELTEDKERDQSDSDENEYFNGIYSIKMDLEKKPPQFLPIGGKKIRIYYKGISKRCVKCFGTGHLKKDCSMQRKDWMEYVSDFMFESEFDLEMLGEAKKYLVKWRAENKEKTTKMESFHNIKHQERIQEEAEQVRRREANKEEIQNISEILQSQSLANGPSSNRTQRTSQTLRTSTEPVGVAPGEKEDEVWSSLSTFGTTKPKQAPEPGKETVKKKRAYVKRNTMGEEKKTDHGRTEDGKQE